MHWNFKVIHIFQYEGATLYELLVDTVLDLQCITRWNSKVLQTLDFKVLYDFELIR